MVDEIKKRRNVRRFVLVISLALNLAVVGVIAGTMVGGGQKGGPQRFDLTVGPLTRAMDEDRREAVRAALHDSDVFPREERNGMRADMSALVATLRADTFDSNAFAQGLSRQRARLQAGQDTVIEVVIDQIDEMTLDERIEFADRLEIQLRRGPRTPRELE